MFSPKLAFELFRRVGNGPGRDMAATQRKPDMRQNLLRLGLAGVFASLVAAAAAAAPLTFSSSAGFAAAIAGASAQGTDGFDALTKGAALGTDPLSRSAGALGYQIVDPTALYASTSADGFLSTNERLGIMTAAGFGANVNAFGANFFGSDLQDRPTAGESIAVHVLESDGDVFDITLTHTDRTSYFGSIGDSATRR